jgi:deoxyribodipyrimidine photo-lyase
MKNKINICWLRRDLRLSDNAALYHALKSGIPTLPLFIFDTNILDQLENKKDRRVQFIYDTLQVLQQQLVNEGSSLLVMHGNPEDTFTTMLKKYSVHTVFTNTDYEPYARERDTAIEKILKTEGVGFHSFKDQVIFEKTEVTKDDGTPYTVFTPYSKKWKSTLEAFHTKAYPTEKYFSNFYQTKALPIPGLNSLGFKPTDHNFPPENINTIILREYANKRDFPGLNATSRLGIHLRFGTISIRQLAAEALKSSPTYLNELIWRDFYQMILWHFPQVGGGKAFKPAYDKIIWRNDMSDFEKWCQGNTGYPIVDAGMRELNETGFMHNRVRMIVASFLAKHLLLDWRLGEAYFAEKLLDYDLAANNGGWQWAAGSGCDAAPYFRIFNPYLQTKKFDPDLAYINKWVPELNELNYPPPMVQNEFARERCLAAYKKALNQR